MAPSYALTSHLCKTLQMSWRQAHQDSRPASSPAGESPQPSPRTSTAGSSPASPYSLPLPASSPISIPAAAKRSMDSDRSGPSASSPQA